MKKILALLLTSIVPLQAIDYRSYPVSAYSTAHILTINPKQNAIKLVKASGTDAKRQTVSALVKSNGAIAGINGGFWRQNGASAGILKINDQWYGTSAKPRGAIGWDQKAGVVLMDRVTTRIRSDKTYEISPAWDGLDYIVGGSPLLVKNGKLIEDYSPEKVSDTFLYRKHSRTAVGIKKNGEWVLAVIDAPFFDPRGGMTAKELAVFMLNLGCMDALNLDGGGSSTMVYNGAVVNVPTGKKAENGKLVEAVSDAIVVMPNPA